MILALHPNTKKILKRLLPITLPMAISGFFFNAATMEVASSGREVPPATKVRPIIDSLTPRLRAIPVAPSTNNCPPYISAARPPMIYRVDFHQGSDLISSSSAECSAGCALSVIGLEGPEEAIANVYPIKMAKKQSNNRPSTLFRMFSDALSRKTSLAQTSKMIEESMQSGISFLSVLRVMTIGANRAVQPTIINVLKILLPTTLPIAMSALPLRAEETLTVSSGAEVPNATIVSPITIGGIRKRLATEAEPSVNPLAPRRMRISPPIRNNIFIAFSV